MAQSWHHLQVLAQRFNKLKCATTKAKFSPSLLTPNDTQRKEKELEEVGKNVRKQESEKKHLGKRIWASHNAATK